MTPLAFRLARVALGLSQAAIAEKLGVSRNTVSRWESGTSPIPQHIELALTTLSRRNEMASKSAFRIIEVECPKCAFRMRRELTCTTDDIGRIVDQTIEAHDLMAHTA